MKEIDFWFSIGSTYSYLSIMRLDDVARAEGVSFRWRPFNVRPIMIEMENRPFIGKPAKAAYMWRDIERRAAMYGIPAKLPAPYPLEELEFANRVAVIGADEGWCEDYVHATYVRWFQQGEPAGVEPNLTGSLQDIDQDAERVIAHARSPEIGAALEEVTEEAKALGIFGSPTYVVDGELFWGDDRLEDAVRWRRTGSLTARGAQASA